MNNFSNNRNIQVFLFSLAALFIVGGFLCMSGEDSSSEYFNPDIFSARRIRIAPMLTLIGYLLIIPAVLCADE